MASTRSISWRDAGARRRSNQPSPIADPLPEGAWRNRQNWPEKTVHELSIMESALSLVLDQARQAGARQVLVIRLRIGALSGVAPDALQFAFEALAPGTLAEKAELAIEPVPARFWCADCRREFVSDDLFAECPGCGRPTGELRAGRELEVASLEIE